ncbi:MAG TPA: autotransporter outer membrane beta-barrel domain-containing protein, partial [Lysobacter sp.]|nr:autotransporter outer membrane beta-barrel domain-containing protein [Lysobacter sp.]
MKARRPLRPSTLALALALAGAASPAFALGCKYERTGDSVVLSRNDLETNRNSYYGWGSSRARVPFDATGLDRLDVRNCLIDDIEHAVLVTDRPIEIVIDNGVLPPGSTAGPYDTFIDLSQRFVNAVAGSTARNRLVVNGGRILSTRGTDGPVPFDVVFNGGAFGGAGNILRFDPNGLVRDGDHLAINGGELTDRIELGGGADTVNVTGGDGSDALTVYGDGSTYVASVLNTFGNRFDDTFTFTGGRIDRVHGDSGDDEAPLDASGMYVGTGAPAGNDRFVLDGGWVRYIMGDDGDDHLDVRGQSTLYEFRGGFGSDTVDVAAGASLDHIYTFEGDSGSGTPLDGYRSRKTNVDVIRFHGHTFNIASDQNHGCASGSSSCSKHVDVHGFERVELLDGTHVTIHAEPNALYGRTLGDGTQVDGQSLLIDATSSLATRSNGLYASTIHLSVVNDGTIDLGQDAAGDVLDISGDWSGTGRVLMSTVFGGDASATDRLRIAGDVTGRTVLDIAQAAGSEGAQTVDGILVVDVRGTSANDAFVLTAPVTTANGLWQYRLEKAGSGVNAGKFVLTSAVPAKDPPTTPPPTNPPPSPPPGGTP